MLFFERMTPRAAGVDTNVWAEDGVWWCPSADSGHQKPLIKGGVQGVGYFHPSYSYFARVSNWEANVANRPADLTDAELRADRLLMCDSLFLWWGTAAWLYNHGVSGPSCHFPGFAGRQDANRVPSVAGLNQLYGDGRVVWTSAKGRDITAFPKGNDSFGKVSGYDIEGSFYIVNH